MSSIEKQNGESQADNSPMIGRPMGKARQNSPMVFQLEGGDSITLLVSLDRLSDIAKRFGMRYAPSKCKMLLQDWISLK